MTKGFASKSNNTVNELRSWCEQQLQTQGLPACTNLIGLSGDASFRRYYRVVCGDASFMAVIAPPATEKNSEFIAIAGQLNAAGLRVPSVLAADLEHGFLLQTDLGDQLLLPALNPESVDALYAQALRSLSRLQQLDTDSLDSYTAAQMHEDLQRFPEWFCGGLLNCSMSAAERQLFEDFCQLLIDAAVSQPQVFTHYDFQSRNLMLCNDGELGIIDFQDARLAPVTYDLASLLRDCYIRWPQQQVQDWACGYANDARRGGIINPDVDDATFLYWFDMMSLQRHVRVLGTFARLFLRDDKPGYLGDIPLVCDYVEQVSAAQPATAEFHRWFTTTAVPLVRQQSWYEEAKS